MKLIFERIFKESTLEEIAHLLKPIFLKHPKVIFKGEVGAGKTTFIKAMAHAFVVLDDVDSPTFSLVNEYEGEIGIFHFDLYRLKGFEELIDIGWEEYLESGNHIWVEWPENAPEAFDEEFILVKLEKMNLEKQRKIQVYDIH